MAFALVQTSADSIGPINNFATAQTINAWTGATNFVVGNLVVVKVSHYAGTASDTLSCTINGLAAAKFERQNPTNAVNAVIIFYAVVATGGARNVVLTPSAGTDHYISVDVEEYSFSGTLSLVGGAVVGADGNSTTPSANTDSGAASGDLAVGAHVVADTGTRTVVSTAPSSPTLGFNEGDSNTNQSGAGASKILSAGGAQAFSWSFTAGGAGNWSALVATFNQTGGGGPAPDYTATVKRDPLEEKPFDTFAISQRARFTHKSSAAAPLPFFRLRRLALDTGEIPWEVRAQRRRPVTVTGLPSTTANDTLGLYRALDEAPLETFTAARRKPFVFVAAGGASAPPGIALEADTALGLASVHTAVVGLASGTNTAFALNSVHTAVVGQAEETDIAFALTSGSAAAPGIALETDTALALAATHAAVVGLSAETDTALALAGSHAAVPGVAVEANTAFARASSHTAPPGLVIETDTALAPGGGASPGIANEADAALALASTHTATPGLALEADMALGLASVHAAAPGVSLETDTGFARTSTHVAPPGVTIESDTALAPGGGAGPGVAVEADTALALAASHTGAPGLALEADLALARASIHTAPPGVAAEADLAVALAATHVAPPGVATGANTALALASSHAAAPGVALEADLALRLGGPPGIAVETDVALNPSSSVAPSVRVTFGSYVLGDVLARAAAV